MPEQSTNSARAVGILPHHNMKPLPIGAIPDYGVLKILSEFSENQGETVYTVPTNKTFYLISASINCVNDSGGGQVFYSFIYDSSDNIIYRLGYSRLRDSELCIVHFQPAIPMPLYEGQYIKQGSEQVNLFVSTSIFGYEVG